MPANFSVLQLLRLLAISAKLNASGNYRARDARDAKSAATSLGSRVRTGSALAAPEGLRQPQILATGAEQREGTLKGP